MAEKEYNLYIDKLVSVWQRQQVKVKADSLDEAIKIAAEYADPFLGEADETNIESVVNYAVAGTEHLLSLRENNDRPTIEIYDADSDAIIFDNKVGSNKEVIIRLDTCEHTDGWITTTSNLHMATCSNCGYQKFI